MRILLFIIMAFGLSFSALAQAPAPAQAPASGSEAEIDARAKEINRSLRCVVCQNQSIDESDAELAADMRKVVKDRLRAGDSNTDVMLYMRDRYGDFVLLKPPLQTNTLLLWFGPLFILLIMLIWYVRRVGAEKDVDPLTEDERRQLEQVLRSKRDEL